ncbi:hypothetical protein FRC17_009460 [Serendipita sp. 399]|nr:hypothetical protein FRC17_009460 [Serendipita sp. 399]
MATGTSFIIRDFEESVPLAGSRISDSRISGSRTSRGFRKESHFKVAFFVAGPIIAYMFMAIATASVLFSAINEHHFRFSSTDALFAEREDGKLDFLPLSGLRQTDISTLISLASSLTRFLGSVCSGIACWRAAYLLLEREGLTLSDIDELVSYPFSPTMAVERSEGRDLPRRLFLPLLRTLFSDP